MKEIFGWIYGFAILTLIIIAVWFGFQLFLLLLLLFFIFLALTRVRHWFMSKGSRAYRERNTKRYGEKVEQIKDS